MTQDTKEREKIRNWLITDDPSIGWDDADEFAGTEAEAVARAERLAAQWYGGDRESTQFVHVWLADADSDERDSDGDPVAEEHVITVDPIEPPCPEADEHDWSNDWALVGGIEENSGVWGKGGGVLIHERCRHCRMWRIKDTWAQDRLTGEQGLTSISYEAPEE